MNKSFDILFFWARQYYRQITVLFFGVLLPLALFGKLADEIHEGDSFAWDNSVLNYIHQHATPHRDSLIAVATRTGGVLTVPILIAIAFAFRFLQRTENALFFGLTVVGAYALNLLAKVFFRRDRPALWTSPAPETGFSFPSGHSMVSMAIATVFVILAWNSKWRWPVLIISSLSTFIVGFSRMYLGVHYPSDVLGGWSAGLIWACGLYLILQKGRKQPAPV